MTGIGIELNCRESCPYKNRYGLRFCANQAWFNKEPCTSQIKRIAGGIMEQHTGIKKVRTYKLSDNLDVVWKKKYRKKMGLEKTTPWARLVDGYLIYEELPFSHTK